MIGLSFKEPSDEEAWALADPRLVRIVRWLRSYVAFATRTTSRLTVTSFYRPHDFGSPHAYHRAADIRIWGWPRELPAKAAFAVNFRWPYSSLGGAPNRHTAIFGALDPKGNHWDHIHLQVPPGR